MRTWMRDLELIVMHLSSGSSMDDQEPTGTGRIALPWLALGIALLGLLVLAWL